MKGSPSAHSSFIRNRD